MRHGSHQQRMRRSFLHLPTLVTLCSCCRRAFILPYLCDIPASAWVALHCWADGTGHGGTLLLLLHGVFGFWRLLPIPSAVLPCLPLPRLPPWPTLPIARRARSLLPYSLYAPHTRDACSLLGGVPHL